MKSDVKIINLPSSRWKEYKNLRLESLKEEPQAYATRYDDAIKRPDEEWISILTAAQKEDKDILFFAEDNGKLVGITGAFFNKDPKDFGIGKIYGVYVNAAYRGKGVGKQLIKNVLERLKTIPGLTKARLMVNENQKAALAMYTQIGFVPVGTDSFVMGDGKEYPELRMEISLI